jgi:hypothetical protein
MKNTQSIVLPNENILACALDSKEIEPIFQEVTAIMGDLDAAEAYNEFLMANIEQEYKLTHSLPVIENLARNLMRSQGYSNSDTQVKLAGAWVNIQKKHEFNPPHMHDGKFVVVIYLKIPYTRDQELKAAPRVPVNKNVGGMLCIQYPDVIGRIRSFNINTDAEFENKMLLFPAHLIHSVFPFRSSDGLRISVSGNLY